MSSYLTSDLAALSAGLLVARLVLGLLMAGHGAQKLFGWFGGHGLAGTAGFFESIGFRPGRAFARGRGRPRSAADCCWRPGFLGPVGPALVLSVMIVAALTVHWKNGVFAAANGIEVPLLYATGAVALALTGSGAYSLDAWLGLQSLWTAGPRLGRDRSRGLRRDRQPVRAAVRRRRRDSSGRRPCPRGRAGRRPVRPPRWESETDRARSAPAPSAPDLGRTRPGPPARRARAGRPPPAPRRRSPSTSPGGISSLQAAAEIRLNPEVSARGPLATPRD